MPIEPSIKRAIAFIDGQNLFHTADALFGCSFPNYNPKALASKVCLDNNWSLKQVRFYTGIPEPAKNPKWSRFWSKRLLRMGREGIFTFTRHLKYMTTEIIDSNGQIKIGEVAREKGIDVRIAIDVISLAINGELDVAVLFSQDQDFSEVVKEINVIAARQDRWIKVVSAYPYKEGGNNPRGIEGADWVKIDEGTYNNCRDLRDYP